MTIRTWQVIAPLVLLASAILWAPAAAVKTADPASAVPDSSRNERVSAWGSIPAPRDTVTATFEDRGVKAWEYPLLVPYHIIRVPVGLVSRGLVGFGYYLSDQTLFKTLHDFELARDMFGGRYILSLTAGGDPGFGVGVVVLYDDLLVEDSEFRLSGEASIQRVNKAALGWRTNAGDMNGWELGAGSRRRPNTKYFGIGEETTQDDASIFRQTLGWAGIERRWGLTGNTSFHLKGLFSSLENGLAETQTDRYPDLSDKYSEDLPYGYGESSNGWSFGAALLRNTVEGGGRPERGVFQRLTAEYFTATDKSNAAHWTYRIDLQRYVPLRHASRTLALRAALLVQDNENTDPIHYQRLITNDDPDLFRGYPDFRFRDEGLVVFSAEYRWPIWTWGETGGSGIDAYLLTDIGQVFDEFKDIRTRTLTASYGFGFRMINSERNFTGRLEFAWSEEGFQFRLRGDQLFEYLKGGLFHGRDQVPTR